MSSTQEREGRRREEQDAAAREALLKAECRRREVVVAAAVMHELGTSTDFILADARQLWDETYRVNVYVGPHVASVRVAHSFFVVTDRDGGILSARPPVEKTY